ncbi:MAG: class I SAM-dependent methyltransferase [Planctomycetes bacterium]|nr:class I SAM-dependent methyltransferase [Planctomycetota bacterium]
MTNGDGSYEALAAEYYDTVAHPTCFNFRIASTIILRKWNSVLAEGDEICEVGCGKSLCAEFLSEKRRSLAHLHLVDSSPSMLAYSKEWQKDVVELVLSDVEALPFSASMFDVVVSILGDPYNTNEFWTELNRVVRPHGRVLFTTPSYEWASQYRDCHDGGVSDKALFMTRKGEKLYVPSYVNPRNEQVALMGANGFSVLETMSVHRRDILLGYISPKIEAVGNEDLPIVSGYLVQKN